MPSRHVAVCAVLAAVLQPATCLMAHIAPLQPPQVAVHRPALLRLSPVARGIVMQEDASGSYRTLGISEDASYDQIMDAYMELSETYADDTSRLGVLEAAKEKVLDDRLRQRMAGTLKSEVTDSPWDEKPVERIPPWVILGEYAQKLFEVPTPKFALKVSNPAPASHHWLRPPVLAPLAFAWRMGPRPARPASVVRRLRR